jgi:GNAT superfamily N-acetyltransferase
VTDLKVRPLDALDDAEYAAAYDVYERGEKHGRRDEYAQIIGATSWRNALTRPLSMRSRSAWAAWRGSTIVGVASMTMPLSDNTHLGWGAVSVDPEHRRQGIGSALLDKAEEALRRAGRRIAVFEVDRPADSGDDWPGTAFATRRGYARALHEAHQVLDLPAAIDLAVSARDGYRVVSWLDRCPDEWAESYAAMMTRFHDEAPTGDLDMEPTDWTVERLRETEADWAARGRRFLVSAAVSPQGDLVGYTEISVNIDDLDAFQDETLVDPAHRGHRLGLAIKAANLVALGSELPDKRRVHTSVSPANDAMNSVNRTLGFEPVEFYDEWQRDLTA